MRKLAFAALPISFICVAVPEARAHVALVADVGFANQTQEIKFGIGHGCAGVDTLSIRVEIPPTVTSVRAMGSTLGPPKVETNSAGIVTAITWQKPTSEIAAGDPNYYTASIRMKLPDAPFTRIYFPTRQICSTPAGASSPPVDWIATAEAPDAGMGEPAPTLLMLPARAPGWNKYTVAQPVDLKTAFADAQIVWKGTAAFSANPTTAALIAGTTGVSTLTALAAGDVVWVKY